MRTWLLVSMLAGTLSLQGCATVGYAPISPFSVPRAELLASVKKVAVVPLLVPPELPGGEAARRVYAKLLEDLLREHGLEVVPASELAPLLDAAVASRGELWDPMTRAWDGRKLRELEAEVGAAAAERFHPDAILWPAVVTLTAPVSYNKASWNGALESILAGSQFSLRVWKGFVPALSLAVTLRRPGGAMLYFKAGGIQVLAKAGREGEPVAVPDSELFSDGIKNWTSVHLALDELFGPKVTGSMGG